MTTESTKTRPTIQVFKKILQLLKQVQATDSKFLSKSHETRKKSIAQDKSNKQGLPKLPTQQTAQKLTSEVTNEQRRGKTKTTSPGKLLHTLSQTPTKQMRARPRRGPRTTTTQSSRSSEHSHRPALRELGGTGNQVPP